MNLPQAQKMKEFNRLYKELDDLYHEIALEYGMSDSIFTIFYDIGYLGEGCMQRDICNLSWVSKQTINSSIRKLEAEGYLYLRPGKGRDMHIFLTDAGKKLMEEKIIPVIKMEQEVLEEMPTEESDELLRLTKKYVVKFQEKVKGT